MNSKLLALTVLASVASLVVALPKGAPACLINPANIAKMGGPSGPRTWKLEAPASYEPAKKVDFKLVAGDGAKTYKGILCFAEPKGDAKMRVGAWDIDESHKSNVDKCEPKGIKAETNSVITHNSPNDKPAGTLRWTPSATQTGDVVVRCVVVGTGPANWQILEPVTLTGPPGAAPPAGGQANGQNLPTGGNRKCKKWRKKGTSGAAGAPDAGKQGPTNAGPAAPPPAPGAPETTAPPAGEGGNSPAPEGQAPPAEGGAPPAEEGAPAPEGAPPAEAAPATEANVGEASTSSSAPAKSASALTCVAAIVVAFFTLV